MGVNSYRIDIYARIAKLNTNVYTPIELMRIDTVLPAKSDSDVLFCLQSYQGLRIDISLVYESYPQDWIYTQVIYRLEEYTS